MWRAGSPARARSCDLAVEALAEQALRAQDQDQQEDDEGDDLLEIHAEQARRKSLNEPVDEAGQHCSLDAADPSQHRDDEHRADEGDAHAGGDREQHAGEAAGGTRERCADPGRERVDLERVDTHQADGLLVERGREDRLPGLGAIEKEIETGGERQREHEYRQPDIGDEHRAERERARGVERVHRAQVGAEDQQKDIHQNEVEAEGEHQREQQARAHQPVEQQPLHAVAEHEQHGHRQRHRQERVDPERREDEIADIGPDHDEGAVGHVDDPHHAPDHGEADRRDGVKSAQKQAVDDRLPEHQPCDPSRTGRPLPSHEASVTLRTASLECRVSIWRLRNIGGEHAFRFPVDDLRDEQGREAVGAVGHELVAGEECLAGDLQHGLAHRGAVEALCLLDRRLQDDARGGAGRGMVLRRMTETLLEVVSELLRILEVAVAVGQRRRPVVDAHDAFGRRPERRTEVRHCDGGGKADRFGRHLQLTQRLHQQDGVLAVAARQHHVGRGRLHAGGDSR